MRVCLRGVVWCGVMCVWQWIIGNSLNITEDLFWIMSGRAQEVKESKMRRLEREEADREASNGSNGAGANTAETQQQAGHKANLSREERSAAHTPLVALASRHQPQTSTS